MRKGIVAFGALAMAVSLGYGLWSLASAEYFSVLQLYTARVQLAELRQLYAEGHDVAQVLPAPEGGFDVQLVMTPEQRDALGELGVQATLWRNSQGKTANQLAAADFQDGFKVWRPYDGAGNIADELRQLAAQRPDLVKLEVVGKTVQDREILALKVTKDANTTADGARPAVLYSAMQHAREWVGLEVNRRLLHHFVDGYGSDPQITELLDTRELWFLPVANPDGYEWTFQPNQRLWRKNMRDNNGDGQVAANGDGVDLNRNFNAHWNYDINGSSSNPASDTFRGTDSASEPETKAMQGLLQRIDFKFQVNYHSAAELLLYAEGWQDQTPSVDHAIFRALSGTRENPAIAGFLPMLSSGLYITNGETCDYAYDEAGTLCWTPELTPGTEGTFEFPDDEAAVQAEFEKNLPFAMDVAMSAADPTNPVSHLGNTIEPIIPAPFAISYGDPQVVEVNALRRLGEMTLKWSINDGPAQSATTSEWAGGERYGVIGSVHYHKLRGRVSGARPGDRVAVWFEGGGQASEPFSYTLAQDTGHPVLVIAAEDYTGISPEYAKKDGPSYLDAYTVALDEAGLQADVYDIDARGRTAPSALGVLSHYRAVVWYTGDDIVPRAVGRLDDTVDKWANDLQLAVRAFLNEGGKLLLTGKYAGYTYYRGDLVDPVADKACDPNLRGADGCESLADDFLQYYLSSYTILDNSGTAPDGTVHGVVGSSEPLEGLNVTLGGGSGAANQDHSLGLMHTSRYMAPETYPQFTSQRAGYFDNPALAPHSGERAIYSDYVPRGYQRLMRTVDLTGAASAKLEFWASLSTGNNRGFLLVEAHTPGQDDWTTLADANGHTNQTLPGTCPMLNNHPHLKHYLTQQGTPGQMGAACSPQGTSGAWHAATGNSGGWQQWSVDLTPWAGKQVELSISYVSNQTRLGLFLDDVTLTAGTQSDTTSFEDDLGAWAIAPAPEGSAANPMEFKAAGADAVPMSAIVTTADTVYMGFGFEAIAGVAERTEVMCRTMDYLLGGTLPCARSGGKPGPLYLPWMWKAR